jgi:hypothetical protein
MGYRKSLPRRRRGTMIPMVEVCELFQGVGAFRVDEV